MTDVLLTEEQREFLLKFPAHLLLLSRFTDDYLDEIYVIKSFIQKHGKMVQVDLGKLFEGAEYDTSVGGIRELLLIAALLLLIIPSYLIQRKG